MLFLTVPSALLHGSVSFDERSLMIGGQRELILSGAVHYPRIHPSEWDAVFRLAKDLGLNAIQTYVFWSAHEPRLSDRGHAHWDGAADLVAFIRLAEKNGLYVTLRIGPYVCGEYNFGGIPVWVRNLDGISCFRCADPVWKAEMARWVKTVVQLVKPQLQPAGNIILLQIENEFHGDQGYLDWAVDMAIRETAGSSVPWLLCHDLAQCVQTNSRNGTYSYKALCTTNGFWMDEYGKNPSQPSPKWLADLRANVSGQPAMWTEDQGWFDQWGVARRIRRSDDQAYGIARFLAHGGAFHNFYMLTGGNNYGLTAGGSVVTGYAPDTVISNFLVPHQPRFDYYRRFFGAVRSFADALLSAPVPKAVSIPSNASGVDAASSAQLLPCTDTDPAHFGELDDNQLWDLSAGGLVRTNASVGPLCLAVVRQGAAKQDVALRLCDAAAEGQRWQFNASTATLASAGWPGPICLGYAPRTGRLVLDPCAQLGLGGATHQQWEFTHNGGLRPKAEQGSCITSVVASSGGIEGHDFGEVAFLANTAEDSFLAAAYRGVNLTLSPKSVLMIDQREKAPVVVLDTATFVDERPSTPRVAASSVAQEWSVWSEKVGYGAKSVVANTLLEQVRLTENEHDYLWYAAAVPNGTTAADVVAKASHGSVFNIFVDGTRLSLLSTAMGMTNSGVGPKTAKGITSVRVRGKTVSGQWTHSWVLEGEAKRIFSPISVGSVPWAEYAKADAESPITWFKATYDLPAFDSAGESIAYALDLSSMWKGIAHVNGFNIGRYWLLEGSCKGDCAPPVKNGHCYMHWSSCDMPTQAWYHIPKGILKPRGNLVVLFEEGVPPKPRDVHQVRLMVLSPQMPPQENSKMLPTQPGATQGQTFVI